MRCQDIAQEIEKLASPPSGLDYDPTCTLGRWQWYSSWLNWVKIWLSNLSRHALRNLSCTTIRPLREAIDRFLKAYQETAAPFECTKAVVHLRTSSNVNSHLYK